MQPCPPTSLRDHFPPAAATIHLPPASHAVASESEKPDAYLDIRERKPVRRGSRPESLSRSANAAPEGWREWGFVTRMSTARLVDEIKGLMHGVRCMPGYAAFTKPLDIRAVIEAFVPEARQAGMIRALFTQRTPGADWASFRALEEQGVQALEELLDLIPETIDTQGFEPFDAEALLLTPIEDPQRAAQSARPGLGLKGFASRPDEGPKDHAIRLLRLTDPRSSEWTFHSAHVSDKRSELAIAERLSQRPCSLDALTSGADRGVRNRMLHNLLFTQQFTARSEEPVVTHLRDTDLKRHEHAALFSLGDCLTYGVFGFLSGPDFASMAQTSQRMERAFAMSPVYQIRANAFFAGSLDVWRQRISSLLGRLQWREPGSPLEGSILRGLDVACRRVEALVSLLAIAPRLRRDVDLAESMARHSPELGRLLKDCDALIAQLKHDPQHTLESRRELAAQDRFVGLVGWYRANCEFASQYEYACKALADPDEGAKFIDALWFVRSGILSVATTQVRECMAGNWGQDPWAELLSREPLLVHSNQY